MKFVRSVWLQRSMPFLLLISLSSGSFSFIAQYEGGKHEVVIHSPQFHPELCGSLQKIQINYGLDVTHVSTVTLFTKIISENYTPGAFYNPVSEDLLTNLDRGPPRLIATL